MIQLAVVEVRVGLTRRLDLRFVISPSTFFLSLIYDVIRVFGTGCVTSIRRSDTVASKQYYFRVPITTGTVTG